MSSNTRSRYQEGSYEKVSRAKGPAVWVFRWRDTGGKQRRKVIGNVNDLPGLSAAKHAAANLKAQINAERETARRMTVSDAWGHFQVHELRNPQINRSPATIQSYLDYFQAHIIPNWGHAFLDDVKAVLLA
jgi:integrase